MADALRAFCNSSGVVCSGRGQCVNGTCVCTNLFEPSTECAATFFASWGDSIYIISWKLLPNPDILPYGPIVLVLPPLIAGVNTLSIRGALSILAHNPKLFQVTIACFAILGVFSIVDLIPDFKRVGFQRIFKMAFPWAKMLIVIFSLCIILESVWFLQNAYVVGHTEIVNVSLRVVPQGIYVAALAAFIAMIVFSWIEIIERARTLDGAEWLRKIRVATIVILIIVIILNCVIMPIRWSIPVDALYDMLSQVQFLVDGILTLYLVVISLVMILRGHSWWQQSDDSQVVKLAREKTKWFIVMLGVLILVVVFAVVSPMVHATSFVFLLFNSIWNVVYFLVLLVGFIFLQRTIFSHGKWFPHYLASSSAMGKSETRSKKKSTSKTTSSSTNKSKTKTKSSSDEDSATRSSMINDKNTPVSRITDETLSIPPPADEKYLKSSNAAYAEPTTEEDEDSSSLSSLSPVTAEVMIEI